MKGSWLRIGRAKILGPAILTAVLVALPVPGTTIAGDALDLEGVGVPDTAKIYAAARGINPDKLPLEPSLGPVPPVTPVSFLVAPRLTPPPAHPPASPQEPSAEPPAEQRRAPLLPNLFGTVAVATTMAPDGWVEHVAQGDAFEACLRDEASCGAEAPTWRQMASTLEGLSVRERLARANAFVNNRIHFRYDDVATGETDNWITPARLLSTGTGDCEDYALAKFWLLRAAGIPEDDMFVMVVRDLVARVGHAYLAVRVDDGFVLLDSRTDRLVAPHMLDEITPVFSITSSGAFLHGRPA